MNKPLKPQLHKHSVSVSGLVIHCKKQNEYITTYYFTKSKNRCMCVNYDRRWDFGTNSTSGAHLSGIEIHYKNNWIKDNLTEIQIKDVPKVIVDVLTYLDRNTIALIWI